MASLPRDSLVARMLQRGTLPAWNLFDKVSQLGHLQVKGPWTGAVCPVPHVASKVPTQGQSAKARPLTDSQSTAATTSSKSSTGSVASSVVGSLASKIRASLGSAREALQRPSRRKIGKQRPSHLVTPKPRHRKNGKQRPSHLAPLAVMQLPRPTAEGLTKVPQISAGGDLATSGRPKEKSKSQERTKSSSSQKKKKRSSAELDATAAPSSSPRGARDTEQLVRKERTGTMAAPKTKPVKKLKQKEPITKRMGLKAPKRAEENYDLSDLEEDEDGNRIEPDRLRKHIPARCSNYTQVAASQADIDPDSIFGSRMPLCDLDAIFPDSFYRSLHPNQPRQRRRGSSCHWIRDALTPHEIHAYAVKMGQSRSWSTVRASIGVTTRPQSGSALQTERVVALVKPKRS
ncbi:INCENP_ARK-bind domain-containing protein [Durusdinium trenchii]|uniref:INCENP_ARK-bind domain-containing protein n=1 Tax=Durusdinium trenchii TaxID=1381693 RepID=A0ABP0MIY0_9DINO